MAPASANGPLKELIAGEEFVPPQVRALQEDDFDNPGFAYVDAGEKLFSLVNGDAGKSCRSCHDVSSPQVKQQLRQAVAKYPTFSREQNSVITLPRRVNMCRQKHMQVQPWSEGSTEMLSMTAYLRTSARGLTANVDVSGPSKATFERGKFLYQSKMGRLQLSCAQCHNDNYGRKYGKDVLSQGHPLSYPVYSVSEKKVISLHERFRLCYELVRAEPLNDGHPDYVSLELYLSWRSKGLPIAAPGVRQ